MGLLVVILSGGLIKNFPLLEADLEAKEPRGVCKAGRDAQQSLFCVGDEGNVFRKEEVLDGALSPVSWCGLGGDGPYMTYIPLSSFRSSVACLSIILKMMLKRVGAKAQPCFTPFEVGKSSDRSLLSRI